MFMENSSIYDTGKYYQPITRRVQRMRDQVVYSKPILCS